MFVFRPRKRGGKGDSGEGGSGAQKRKAHYQAFWGVLIDLIVELLVLIIKPFDNQTES